MKKDKTTIKGLNISIIFLTIIFLCLLIPSIFDIYYFERIWPYMIMIGGTTLFTIFIKHKKSVPLALIIMITTLLAILGSQFFFYFVIPTRGNYQPITNTNLMSMFQINNKLTVIYKPDYLKEGDTIISHINVCSNNYEICKTLENFTIDAYYFDEMEIIQHIYQNKSVKNAFELTYLGHLINVELKIDNNSYSFNVPKPSISQSISLEINRHPGYAFFALISAILAVISFVWMIIKPSNSKIILIEYKKEINQVKTTIVNIFKKERN